VKLCNILYTVTMAIIITEIRFIVSLILKHICDLLLYTLTGLTVCLRRARPALREAVLNDNNVC